MNLYRKPIAVFILLIISLAFFYGQAFFAPFYREDAEFLRVSLPADLLRAIPGIHYHPISIQLFYGFSKIAFGSNYILYHLVLFLFYSGGLYFIYLLVKDLTRSTRKGLIVAFLYAFNISFFPLFYWTAVSYFAISAFFLFGALLAFTKPSRKGAIVSFVMTLGAIGSNEAAIVVFGLFLLLAWYKKNYPLRLWGLSLMGTIYFILRFVLFKLPVQEAYTMEFNLKVIKTIQWYFLRTLNLPEGIRFSGDSFLTIFFGLFVVSLVAAVVLYLKTKKKNLRIVLFGGAWFLIGAAPFYFLPYHMSAFYLTYAFLGIAIIMTEILGKYKPLIIFACVVYFLLAIRGLAFLERTHWIILKNAGAPQKFYTIEEAYDYRN